MVRKEKKNNSRSHVSHDGTLVTVNRELWCAWNIKKCQQTCLLKMTVELMYKYADALSLQGYMQLY